jgi:hypothetical protein
MLLPHDMEAVVEKCWDAINARVTSTLIEIGDPPADGALDGIDPLHHMYGCGAWGCAYPTSQRRWTVKVSADPTELDIVAAVLTTKELRENPGIAYILGIWRLPETVYSEAQDETFTLHVTLREAINPVEYDLVDTEHEEVLIQALHELRITAMELNENALSLAAAERRGDTDPYYLNQYRVAEELWIRQLSALRYEYETSALAEFISDFARDFNTALADIHAGNVGLREHSLSDLGLPEHFVNDTWVAFDLGHSLISRGSEVPLISNPSRIPVI